MTDSVGPLVTESLSHSWPRHDVTPSRRHAVTAELVGDTASAPWPGETPPDGFVTPKVIPTLGVALWHAHHNLGVHDPAFVREWYEDMEGRFWCDDKGEPIRNWGMLLTVWVRNRARFAALRAVPSEKVPWANKKVFR